MVDKLSVNNCARQRSNLIKRRIVEGKSFKYSS